MSDPVSKVDPNGESYTDLDSSAHAVLSGLDNNDQEQAGVIVASPDGKFHSTIPMASKLHDSFELRVALQKGWKIAGIYHTHPGSDQDGQYFSPQDLEMAGKLNVPSYIRFQKDGAIRKYIPGQTATQTIAAAGNKFGHKVAVGDALSDTPPPQMVAALSSPPAQTPEALTKALTP